MTDMNTGQRADLVAISTDSGGNPRQVVASWAQDTSAFGDLVTNADGSATFTPNGVEGTVSVAASAEGLSATMDLVITRGAGGTNVLSIRVTLTQI